MECIITEIQLNKEKENAICLVADKYSIIGKMTIRFFFDFFEPAMKRDCEIDSFRRKCF